MLFTISSITERCYNFILFNPLVRRVLSPTSLKTRRVRERIGRWGERLALRTITAAGLIPVSVNWRSHRGEVDIIALDRRSLVIIEVKTRYASSKKSYAAIKAINHSKRRMLAKTHQGFRRNHGPLLRRYAVRHSRFDAIEVYYSRTKFGFFQLKEIRWHKGLSVGLN